MDLEPENTLRSVQRALDLGFKIIEIDVHLVDHEVIVIHDDTLDRTTNGHGKLTDYSFAELRKLDAGNGEKIPLLQEVLDLIEGKAILNIELKGKAVVRPVIEIIYGRDDVILSSFDWNQLNVARNQDEALRIGVLGDGMEAYFFANKINAYSLHPSVELVTAEDVQRAHASDILVFPYTVTTPEQRERMQLIQSDGYFANKLILSLPSS